MQTEKKINEVEGFSFDIYNIEEEVHLWILDRNGKAVLFLDHYFPIIYLDGEEEEVRKIIKRIEEYLAIKVDQKFIDKSAKNFSDSIESGDLYKTLKGADNK